MSINCKHGVSVNLSTNENAMQKREEYQTHKSTMHSGIKRENADAGEEGEQEEEIADNGEYGEDGEEGEE